MEQTLKESSAVVLGNGAYPTAEVPLRLLDSASFLLCCDGAVNKLVAHGGTPDFIIGDGDSISPENKRRFADRFQQVADQETNDQTKAVNYLFEKGYRNISIVGATGGREDHTLGNISLLMEYRRRGVEIRMYTDYGLFLPAKDTLTLRTLPGKQVSVFSFGATQLEGSGLKYPLYDFTAWWQGTLNEATSSEVTVRAQGEFLVFLEY